MRRSLILLAAVVGALVVAAPAGAFRLGHALRPVADNPADHLVDIAPDPEVCDTATHCSPTPKPGTTAFVGWLRRHADGVFRGSYRCERWGAHEASLHAENRAVDWHLDVSDAAERHEARRLIELFLAPTRQVRSTRWRGAWASRRSSGTAAAGAPGCRTSFPTAVPQQARRRPQACRSDDRPPQPHPFRTLQAGRHAPHVVLDARLSGRAVARATIPLLSRAWLTRRP